MFAINVPLASLADLRTQLVTGTN